MKQSLEKEKKKERLGRCPPFYNKLQQWNNIVDKEKKEKEKVIIRKCQPLDHN